MNLTVSTDPMYQFRVDRIIPIEFQGFDLSFTDASLFMVLSVLVGAGFLLVSAKGELVPSRLQSMGEMTYQFVAGMVRDVNGEEGMKFFPFIFSLFLFILMANMLGMIPGSHTVTSHIAVTFALAILAISVVIIYGVWKNGFKFLKIFAPSGVPMAIMPLIVLIEIFSFLSRPLSLGMRLFANMLAGHIALKIFAGFVPMLAGLGYLGWIGAIAPFAMTIGITALEFLVSFLQAYVFAILTCVYLNDALHPGH
jgi:F-type H+-transporting ATPase subunit a